MPTPQPGPFKPIKAPCAQRSPLCGFPPRTRVEGLRFIRSLDRWNRQLQGGYLESFRHTVREELRRPLDCALMHYLVDAVQINMFKPMFGVYPMVFSNVLNCAAAGQNALSTKSPIIPTLTSAKSHQRFNLSKPTKGRPRVAKLSA